jgi:hypothetical protein
VVNVFLVKKIPFSFVLEELDSLSPVVKPMFGGALVYIGEKMMLFFRDLEKDPQENGVWLATTVEAYRSLAAEFPSAPTKIEINQSPWLRLPSASPDFEQQALRACEMILAGDPRIGRAKSPERVRAAAKRKSVKSKK